jgi:hypothetical protein
MQPIPLGIIGLKAYLDNFVDDVEFIENEVGYIELTNEAFVNPPTVFIDGILLTYGVSTDRRYLFFEPATNTLYIINGLINEGENVQIFL